MTIPFNARLGFKTIRVLIRKVCQLIVKYEPRWSAYLTPEQRDKFSDLMVLCTIIIDIIDELYGEPHPE